MKDKEYFKLMLALAGVGFEEIGDKIVLKAKEHTKVLGYTGFVTEFNFNADGSLKDVEVWE
jgi:hypothetical protein